ncbi:MAG TPA: terminase family protein [Terriglobales bacterium]|nr:terminase family protein [Terriglobales bacterium]
MDRPEPHGVCFRRIKYWPLPSQRKFHGAKTRFKGFSGPIGSGKSQALCQEAIKLSYINAGRLGLIGAPTYPMLRDATLATFFDILNANLIPYEYSKADNVITMTDSGSRILCRSVDEFERLRGTNLAWFALDELTYTPEPAWLVLEGRLRDPRAKQLCGFAAWTPKGYDWVYRKFIANRMAGYDATIAQPYENRHLLDQIPDFYDLLKQSYDDSYFQQEVLGKYLNVQAGLVYHAFSRQEHVTHLEVHPGAPLLWALDFNVDPMSAVVVQVIKGTVYVLDEIVLRHASTLQACEEFKRRYPRHTRGLVIYGDASGNNLHTTGTSDYLIIREYFSEHYSSPPVYKVPKANPSVRDRITLTNAKLRNASGGIQLFIDPQCAELIKDFEQVCYKADSNIPDKERDRNRTHVSDALGYLLWQECRPLQPIGDRTKRLF